MPILDRSVLAGCLVFLAIFIAYHMAFEGPRQNAENQRIARACIRMDPTNLAIKVRSGTTKCVAERFVVKDPIILQNEQGEMIVVSDKSALISVPELSKDNSHSNARLAGQ